MDAKENPEAGDEPAQGAKGNAQPDRSTELDTGQAPVECTPASARKISLRTVWRFERLIRADRDVARALLTEFGLKQLCDLEGKDDAGFNRRLGEVRALIPEREPTSTPGCLTQDQPQLEGTGGPAEQPLGFLKGHRQGWLPDWYVQLVAIVPDGPITAKAVHPDQIDELLPFIKQHNGKANLYFAVNPLIRDPGKKASKADIAALCYHHIDHDPPKEALTPEAHAAWKLTARQLIADGGLPVPSEVVDSGNGLGIFYRLKEPILHDGSNTDELESINKRLELALGSDHCHDICRIMRLPGTLNLPTASKLKKGRVVVPAALLEQNDKTYGPDAFAFLSQVDTAKPTAKVKATAKTIMPTPIATNGSPLPLIGLSTDQQALVEGTLPEGQRSEVMYGLLNKLIDGGAALADVLTTVLHTPGLWAYCTSKRRNEEEAMKFAEREVKKAYAESWTGPRDDQGCFDTPVKSSKKPAPAIRFPMPFRGVMEGAVNAVLEGAHKPQVELTTLATLIAMASGCGGYFALPNGARCNLYGCGIAVTGAGKDIPLRAAMALAGQAGAEVKGRMASGQGLEELLEDYRGLLIAIDEVAHFFCNMTGKGAQPWMVELAGILLSLFSASSGSYPTRTKVGAKGRLIQHPAVSLLGFATPEKLGEALKLDNIADGLLGRDLFVQSRSDPKPRRSLKPIHMPDVAKTAMLRMETVAGDFAADKKETLITISDEADQALDALLEEFHQRGLSTCSPFAKALHVRSYEKAERIAGVLAVYDNHVYPVITMEHVAWAAAFVRASDATILAFVGDYMHCGETQANAAMLVGFLKEGQFTPLRTAEDDALKAGWVPRSVLLRRAKMLNSKTFVEALIYLTDTTAIEHRAADQGIPAVRLSE
ncbi:YfjI family protein [Pseudomonas sp. LS1212]|uniref:YfjI family protein n=1 Tax=Pseudomonas sp. LS1212 TaxID=2972478 RepID=UPI00215B8EA6|nr:YfjI family protein [Pseudomonas sp. LS1212]UVJ46220.1 YfjI family protein [Pseudomonas sp. LS1212]